MTKKPQPTKPVPDFKSHDDRDKFFKEHADYFTAVKFQGVGKYDRIEAQALEEAKRLAQTKAIIGGGRYMIYAVIGGQSAYVTTMSATGEVLK